MKTKLLIVIVAIATIFASCNKDTVETLPSMSANVNDTVWTATPAIVTGASYSGYITFLGYNVDGNKMSITVKMGDDLKAGTYPISLNPFTDDGGLQIPKLTTYGIYMGNKDETNETAPRNYYSTSGSVIITGVDEKKITGTFSFTAINKNKEQIEIKDGKFANVTITAASSK